MTTGEAMGIFDKLARKKAESPLTPQEAVGVLLYLTVAADGEISDDEKEGFIALSNQMKLFRGQTVDQFNLMIDKAAFLLSQHGFETTLERAAAIIPADLRPTAFIWASELAFADGKVTDEESEFLTAVYLALGMEEDLALKIIEVIQMKHHG
jgi:uncharacterized tellurite resistance protein B-like protein